ncbi:MAG: FAD-dependent oxidoreductase [Syntrophobacteraceae bacterium]
MAELNGMLVGVWGDRVVDRRYGGGESESFGGLEQFGDYEPGNRVKAVLGWNGFFLFDEDVDLIDMARAYLDVVQGESCGKCVPCRMGTRVAADILTRIGDGKGVEEDLETLRRVGEVVKAGSMCELGHTSMNAVLALLDHFEGEFRQAIVDGKHRRRGSYHTKVTAPCIEACPERLDIPRYIEYIKSARYTESLSVIHERNPLSSVCGRVCVRFCEFACRRAKLDDPVNIKHLKRFVSDVEMDAAVKRYDPVVTIKPGAPKIAVVGAGPAGMTAAYHLLLKGYPVEIYEALHEPGGMAAMGIPDYRLPREVLRAEFETLQRMGVTIHYGSALGRDFTLESLKARGFGAIFLAIGAQKGTIMGVEGEDRDPAGYFPGIDFLRRVNLNESIGVGNVAVVVGGGNVAMDCSRSALRLGVKKVHLVYRRTREEMPADHEEIHDAMEEGVEFHFLSNPVRLLIEDDRIVGVECIRMGLGEPDASGRRRPVPVEGSGFVIECDTVIPAIGQKVDASCLQGACCPELTRWDTVKCDTDTLQTSQESIFAGGDCVTGPATLIEAMAAGFRVSNSVDQYLREGSVALTEDERMSKVFRTVAAIDEDRVDRLGAGLRRIKMPMRSVEDRVDDFDEVEMGLSPEDALLEADRCLRCYRILLVAAEK